VHHSVTISPYQSILISDVPITEDLQDPTLFSSIRARYQNIVEELLASDHPPEANFDAFKARSHSTPFLCRYRSCPRAEQGFPSFKLRQDHEDSHSPQFRRTDSMCGFFGWRFNTPAAIKKHAAQYHQEPNQAIVPTPPAKRPRQPGETRPLFGLRERSSVVIGSQAGDGEPLPPAAIEPALASAYASPKSENPKLQSLPDINTTSSRQIWRQNHPYAASRAIRPPATPTANRRRRTAEIDRAADIAAAAAGADAKDAADGYESWPVGGITNGIGAGGRQNVVANQHVIGGQPQMTDRQREQFLASQFQQAEAAQARQ